jgi:hypothetical protein
MTKKKGKRERNDINNKREKIKKIHLVGAI